MWQFFANLWQGLITWLGSAMDNMTTAIIRALQGMGNWLSTTFGGLFRELTRFLSAILQPLLDLVGGLVYLLMNLVDVIILVVQTLLLLVQVLFGIAGGLVRTFAALAQFDPNTVTVERNPYSVGTDLLLGQFSRIGGDVLAQVLAWAVWLLLAVAVIRLFAREKSA